MESLKQNQMQVSGENSQKIEIPAAVYTQNVKHMQCDHITTAQWMQPVPILIRECTPNMELQVAVESFCRLNAMVFPTFGRAKVYNRGFFVPFRTIFPIWNQFITAEKIYSKDSAAFGIVTAVPQVSNADLLGCLIGFSTAGTSTDYNISYYDGNATQYRKLQPRGLYLLKLFECLGYSINWLQNDTTNYSALPILAFAKVLIDWYYPSQFVNNTLISTIEPYFNTDHLLGTKIPQSVINAIAALAQFSSYDDHLLTNAWVNPTGPNDGTENTILMEDITNNASASRQAVSNSSTMVDSPTTPTVKPTNGTPFVGSKGTATSTNVTTGVFTQYVDDVLQAMTDYTKRHQLSSVRAVDRYLAEYGINLSSEIMRRSIKLGEDSFNINFGDVMSNSDTTGASLGDYAGKGIGYGRKVLACRLGNEFGYFFVINSIIPHVGYYQGNDPLIDHIATLDFYHGDYDNIGVQEIKARNVYNSDEYSANYNTSAIHSKVFGFAPRYNEYKTVKDRVSGLYRVHGENLGMDSHHLMRDLSSFFTNVASITMSADFVRGVDASQYNRMFYGLVPNKDNINFVHHFEIDQCDTMKPLYDTYDFEATAKVVEMHSNASKVQ